MSEKAIDVAGMKFAVQLFTESFEAPNGPAACTSNCCRHGVYLDPTERDRIMARADLIEKYLDETQTNERDNWFDNTEEEDADFPSGNHVSTEVYNGKCVFLDRLGRCSLQVAEKEECLNRFSLKPYYCVLFPITKVDGIFEYDDLCSGDASCCTAVKADGKKIVEVCSIELEFALGGAKHEEVLKYFRNNFSGTKNQETLKNA